MWLCCLHVLLCSKSNPTKATTTNTTTTTTTSHEPTTAPTTEAVSSFAHMPLSEKDTIALAHQLVNTIHNGLVLEGNVRAQIRGLLQTSKLAFRDHPLWLHVTAAPPHEAILQRLAVCVGVEASVVTSTHGYSDSAEFFKELDGWMAWYSIVRRNVTVRDRVALRRACELFGDTDSTVSAPRTRSNATETEPENDVAGVSSTNGIASLARIREASRLVRAQVVVDGLLANQWLGDVPTGVRYCLH